MNICEVHLLFCWCSSYPIFGTEESFTLVPLCSQLCQVNGNCYPLLGRTSIPPEAAVPEVNPTLCLRVTTENHNSHTFSETMLYSPREEAEQGEFQEWTLVSRGQQVTSHIWHKVMICRDRTCVLGEGPCSFPFTPQHQWKDAEGGWQEATWRTCSNRTKEHVLSLKQRKMFPHRLGGLLITW